MAPEVVVFNPRGPRLTEWDLIEELEEARQLALRIEAPGAAVAATMAKGRLLGMGITTRVQMEKVQSFASMNLEQVFIQVKNELGEDAAKMVKSFHRKLQLKREDDQ